MDRGVDLRGDDGSLDERLEELSVAFRERILERLHGLTTPEAIASRVLYERILDSCQTLRLLGRQARHRWEVDGMTILRAAYDAVIQLLWLLHDPAQRCERGSLYLAFTHIETEFALRWMSRSDSGLAAHLKRSPLRRAGEPRHDAMLKALGPAYATSERAQKSFQDPAERGDDGWIPGLRRHWYPGELKHLAKDVGYSDECALFVLSASASVHSSAFHLMERPSIRGEYQPFLASQLAHRAAGAIADSFGFELTEEEWAVVRHSRQSINERPQGGQ